MDSASSAPAMKKSQSSYNHQHKMKNSKAKRAIARNRNSPFECLIFIVEFSLQTQLSISI